MKRLMFITLLLVPITSFAINTSERFWFCRQTGLLDGKLYTFMSEIWEDSYSNNYDLRQLSFEKFIQKKTQSKFNPSFEAKCREYYNPKHAKKHRKVEIDTSNKYQANVVELDWKWEPDAETDSNKLIR